MNIFASYFRNVVSVMLTMVSITLQAQQENEPQFPNILTGFYAYGGIGPAIPIGSYGSERSIGFDLNTAMEYRYKSGLLLRGMFDFSSFAFERGTISQISNGKEYALSGSNNLVSLSFSGGYYKNIGRFIPYAFAGIGVSFLSKPGVEVNEIDGYVDTSLLVNGYFSTIGGAGIDFILNPVKDSDLDKKKSLFIIYVESFYTYIPVVTETSSHRLNLITFNLGIKNKF